MTLHMRGESLCVKPPLSPSTQPESADSQPSTPCTTESLPSPEAPPVTNVNQCGEYGSAALLTLGVLIFHCLQSIFTELTINTIPPGNPAVLSFLHTLSLFTIAPAMAYRKNRCERRGPLHLHCIMAVMIFSGTFFTSWSSDYLDFPTQVMLKSSKILIVMVLRAAVRREKSAPEEWFWASVLCTGMALFGVKEWGNPDSPSDPHVMLKGVGLIILSGVAEALCGVIQEELFQSYRTSREEILCMAALFAMPVSVALVAKQGAPAVSVLTSYPHVAVYSWLGALTSTLGTVCILCMIEQFDSAFSTIATNIRKVLSVVLSAIIFGNTITMMQAAGATLIGVGTVCGERISARRRASRTKDKQQ